MRDTEFHALLRWNSNNLLSRVSRTKVVISETDRVVSRIRDLYVAEKFDARSAATVSAAARKYSRSADVLLAVAEYRQLHWPWRWARQQQAYRRVLNLDPHNARAWENLAAVFDMSGQLAEAARAAQQAIRFGDDPDAVAMLARIRAQQGKKAESRRLVKTVRRARSKWARNTAREVLEGEWEPIE